MTETDVCNEALALVGADRITSLDDGSKQARDCKLFYSTLRDHRLRSHFWNFATARQQLQQIVDAPVFGYTFAYQLPSDFLRITKYTSAQLFVSDNVINIWPEPDHMFFEHFRIEENKRLLSHDGQVYIEYVKREENPDLWDPMFYQALTTEMAAKLEMSLMKDARAAQTMYELAQSLWLDAMATDGQEGTPNIITVPDLIAPRW